MAEVLSLPLTSSELLPKLLLALYSGLSLEDASQLGGFFLCFVFVCHFLRLDNGRRGKKLKYPEDILKSHDLSFKSSPVSYCKL